MKEINATDREGIEYMLNVINIVDMVKITYKFLMKSIFIFTYLKKK